jgi:3-oxoacyl-[acyl-carrier-protein] synthase-3
VKYRPVGLESWGTYIPEERHTAEHISEETGIPEDILIEKFGLTSKSVPGPEDHTVAMGAEASFQALERANLDPEDLDVIIWAGEVYAERPMQTYGIKLQKYLGNPTTPWAFDVNQRCGTFLVGMLIAKSFMQIHPEMDRILVASGYRNSDLINYQNENSRFMFSLAASGVAAVLKADSRENEILEISAITDGRFADDVYVPAGGTVEPISCEAIENDEIYLDVPDPDGLKKRLDDFSMNSFERVINDAIERSGYTTDDIDYLALLHMKRSAFEYVCNAVGVDPYEESTYLEKLGHNGQNDGILSIEFGVNSGKIKEGDLVVIAAAGIGWAWNAGVIKWGKPD